MTTTTNPIDQIFDLFVRAGQGAYFGEAVSEMEHALQAARLAECAGARPALVAAALLHDVGHLLHGLPENIAEHGVDGRHEDIGADWLHRYFPAEVVAPVRLHVPAKRYLATVDRGYWNALSPASKRSLELQGGFFSEPEVRAFESLAAFEDAIAVRRWDDGAKTPNLETPGLEHYRTTLQEVVNRNS